MNPYHKIVYRVNCEEKGVTHMFLFLLVPKAGIEPARGFPQRILSA